MAQLSENAQRLTRLAARDERDVVEGAAGTRGSGFTHHAARGWTVADTVSSSVTIDALGDRPQLSLQRVCGTGQAVAASASMPVRRGLEYVAQATATVSAGSIGVQLTFTDSTGCAIATHTSVPRRATRRPGGLAVSASPPGGASHARVELYTGVGEATTAVVRDVRLNAGGAITEVGSPLHVSSIHTAVTGSGPDGTAVVYALTRGEPPILSVLDIATGEAATTITLPESEGAYGAFGLAQGPDHTVYIAATNGCLYRYRPGERRAVRVMQADGESSTFWRITIDDCGRVYGGLYPQGGIVRYDPSTGQAVQIGIPGSSEYARSIAVADGVLWVGMGTPARLVRLDAESLGGAEDVPLPDGFVEAHAMVYDLALCGRRLFVRGSEANRIHALDLDSQVWSTCLDTGAGVDFASSSEGDVYWLGASGALRRLAAGHLEPTDTGVHAAPTSAVSVTATGLGWAGDALVFIDSTGMIHAYEPATGRVRDVQADVPHTNHAIHRLTEAVDGRIYVTGFAPGGLAWYDIATEDIGECPPGSLRQAEHAVYHHGRLWLGTYPGADVLVFDPNREPEPGVNPALVAQLRRVTHPAQDRPYALAGAPRGVYVGTVPHYGHRGGKLFVVSDDLTSAQLVPLPMGVGEHSVTALAYDADTNSVFVGTSRCGGLGVAPVPGSARVLRLSALDHGVIWETAPLDGAVSVSSLVVRGSELWGATPGEVFAMDKATGGVRSSADVAPFPFADVHPAWGAAKLVTGSDGRIHGQINGHVVVFGDDPQAWTVLATNTATGRCAAFAHDDNGDSYFAHGSVLYRLTRGMEAS